MPVSLEARERKQPIHAEPELGGLDFARISRADRVDRVRPDNAGLQEIEAAEELQSLRMKQPGVETEVGNR